MRNLEAKFQLTDREAARKRAEAIGFIYRASLAQRDTFFAASNGKLKLREQDDGASLIHYRRDRHDRLELSNYEIVPVSRPSELREMLGVALGIVAQVIKRRILLTRENIRLHLDEVAGLGAFGEIEVVLAEAETAERYAPAVEDILAALKIMTADLIHRSYFELMTSRAPSN